MIKRTKKIICFILTVIMLVGMAMPCFAENEEYPTIYITGAQTNDIYSADGEKIYPIGADAGAIIKEAIGPCLEKLAIGLLTDDYKDYAAEFYNAFVPVFEKVVLDKNGDVTNGSHPRNLASKVSVSNKTSGYGMWDYRFWYDWRESPMKTAGELQAYIDRVIEATGKDKVNLVGRCYGANVIAAYVELNKVHACENVADIVYYAQSIEGIDFMTALYTGELFLDPEATENFVNWYIENENLIEDDVTAALVVSLVELFKQIEVLDLASDAVDLLIERIRNDLIPPIIRDTFGTWTSYWAMVTEDKFETAINFIYSGCEDEYKGCIEKAKNYHNIVQRNHENTLKEMSNNGINYHIFVKYNFPEYPIWEGSSAQSDGDTTVYRQSFGATAADYGEVLSDSYINTLTDKRYLSPDNKVDASTAMLPEKTWFIKNLHHNYWEVMHNLTLDIMKNDYTISNPGPYHQYMDAATDMKEVTPDEDYTKPADNKLASLMRFLTAFFNFIAKLISGELNLKEIF